MFKLLVVEDNSEELSTCKSSVATYARQHSIQINMVGCSTVEEALKKLDSSFDGSIVDLKLGSESDGGTRIIAWLKESNLRIPVAILTGTPDTADANFAYIGVFKKGETAYSEILDRLLDIHRTGLTRIMGGRGLLEETLQKVFERNILPKQSTWIGHARSDAQGTERALLRYTLNCLMQLLDEGDEQRYADEVYIQPPLVEGLRTGSIVTEKPHGAFHVVMNPACDLVLRDNGKMKTDRILLCEVDPIDIAKEPARIQQSKLRTKISKIRKCKHHSDDAISYKSVLEDGEESFERTISGFFRNTYSLYYHWLPTTDSFPGGFLNFRKLRTVSATMYSDGFHNPNIQISGAFVKDIVSRFASFYARQGQPDVNCKAQLSTYLEPNQII